VSSEQFVKRHAKRVKISAVKQGKDETQPARQRYQWKTCNANFDDLNNTIFAGHYQPLRMWILCLYLMGLNLSNRQIAQDLDRLARKTICFYKSIVMHDIVIGLFINRHEFCFQSSSISQQM
jgi:transposase-like protein